MRNCLDGMGRVENRMVLDAQWPEYGGEEDGTLPICDCCGEKIRQSRALHVQSGRKRIWLCDGCIEDSKEVIGY